MKKRHTRSRKSRANTCKGNRVGGLKIAESLGATGLKWLPNQDSNLGPRNNIL